MESGDFNGRKLKIIVEEKEWFLFLENKKHLRVLQAEEEIVFTFLTGL